MKIFSKQKDYYDSALAYGVDNTVIFKRKEEVKEYKYSKYIYNKTVNKDNIFSQFSDNLKKVIEQHYENKSFSLFHWRNEISLDKYLYDFEFGLIFFCGNYYPFIKTIFYNNKMVVKKITSYDIENLKKELKKELGEKKATLFFESLSWKKERKDYLLGLFFKEKLTGIDFNDLHHELDTPYFSLNLSELTRTPILKDYQFAKVKDPFMAYQEIESYISGVLGGNSPKMLEISDINRLEAHGFDKVKSFRKEKEK